MSISLLFEKLRALDIKITLNGEQLKINAPKGAVTPDLQAEIVANKQAIVAFLRETETLAQQRSKPIQRHSYGSTIPLSFAQQRMWFLEQLGKNDATYVLSYGKQIAACLDEKVLNKCFTEIARRHEILRTSFHHQDEQPVQVIHPSLDIFVEVVQLEDASEADQQKKLRQMIDEKCSCPFDLSQAPLFRVTLFHLGQKSDFLLINMHHIIGDNASIMNFSRELSALYPVFQQGNASPVEALPFQYADYVFWQQETLQGAVLDEQVAYWKEKLSGDIPRLDLPTDHPWLEMEDNRAGEQYLLLPPALSEELEALSQRQGITLFSLLLAAFKVLLYRLTGQEDLTVGTPVWGRSRPEFEEMIGLFLNTLTLRTDFSGNPSFRQALERVNETMLGAFSHQEVPFERLVEKIQPERSLSHHPFFDVFINFLQPRSNLRDDLMLALEPIKLSEPETKFPISVYIVHTAERINFVFTYRKALYSNERMACIAGQFQYLLEQIVQNPDLGIDNYSLAAPSASDILPDPTETINAPNADPVFEMVLHRAAEQPDHPAVEQSGHRWSYQQLSETAQALASALQQTGCQPGEVVAVSGLKSFGLIIGVLGALGSGGVLLTLDPALPPRRIETMLQEAKAKWLIQVASPDFTFPSIQLPEDLSCLQISAQTGRLEYGIPYAENLPFNSPVRPEDPAYIFFTSGTTNIPKGVLGTHRGLSHFLTWQRDTFSIGPGDRAAQLTALSFDVVMRDILTPLISGASLCLPDPRTALASEGLLLWLHEQKITIMHTVPAIAFNWLNQAPPGLRFDALRLVFFAGEPLLDTLCLRWRDTLAPNCNMINLYGPTETTLAKCYFQVPEVPLPGVQPVGRPLPQTQALILNKAGGLCGVGEPGEIVIRTPFRTLGYINNAEEQAHRFIPNPFNMDPSDLVYRSGDNGRYRPDGNINILGRQDDQVKIHGVRIELGEVTAALAEHPQVKSAFVMVRKEETGPYLSAYVVTSPGTTIPPDQLRYHMADRLPLAMVPSRYVFLDSLPLGPNGKVDRSALPVPADSSVNNEKPSQPRDVVEAKLIQIWKKLLRTDKVGVQDDFFALGGHSMLAVQMFIQIEEALGVNLPLTSLFQKANIEHLAELINQQRGPTTWASLVHIKPSGSRRPLFCIHGLTGDVFWFGRLVPHMDPDQPLWGLQSQGLDGVQEPLTTVEDMASLYIREMKSIQPEGPYNICGYSFGGSLAYELACQLEAQGDEVSLLAIIDHANAKSGYYQVHLSPSFFISVLKNLPHRINDILNLKPYQLFARIERKLRLSAKLMKSSPSQALNTAEAGEIIDHAAHLPAHVQKVIEMNFRAAREYTPRTYHGELTLLKARGGRLLVSHDPLLGWGKFTDHVKVRMIPGSHLSLFEPHRVQHLAQALQACLDEIQI